MDPAVSDYIRSIEDGTLLKNTGQFFCAISFSVSDQGVNMDREPSDIHSELSKLRSDIRSELKSIRREVETVLV